MEEETELKVWPCPICKREWGSVSLKPEECPFCKKKKGEDDMDTPLNLLSNKEIEYFKETLRKSDNTTEITKELYTKLKSKNPNLKVTKKAIKYLLDKLSDRSKIRNNKISNETFNSIGLSSEETEYFKKILRKGTDIKEITKELYDKLKNKESVKTKLTKKAIKYLLDKLKKQLKNEEDNISNIVFNSLSCEELRKCHYCNGELVITGLMRSHGGVKIKHTPDTYYYCLNCRKSHSYNHRCKDTTEKTNDIIFADSWSD